jgi:HEPN domain-containing protein
MKRQTAQWVLKAEEDWAGARELAARTPPLRDLVCFHCQQAAEKYLKSLLQELGVAVPKTHNLKDLLNLVAPHDGSLARLERFLVALTGYAVEYRYPGVRATTRRMEAALRHAERVRTVLRARLHLPP